MAEAADGIAIAQIIRARVRGAVDDAESITAAVRQRFDVTDIDDENLHRWVSDALDQQAADEADWPADTDCDRLDVTLTSLLRHGIIARQNAGVTPADALADVARAFVEAGGDDAGVIGFCFYDYQDLLRAADDGDLLLSFGEVHGDPEGGVHIGRLIRDAFEANGFTVRWDGTLADRIAVTDLVWQRRR
jgi:hypothetical protein